MHYYALIYHDIANNHYNIYITMADSFFEAEKKGKEDIKKDKEQNKNIIFYRCEYIDKQKLERGEIVFCFAC